jgi:hypothetical protein
MTFRSAAVAAILLLAACGNGEPANNASAVANAPAPAAPANSAIATPAPPLVVNAAEPAPDLEGARVLIGQLYMPYTRGQMPNAGNVYTPELRRAIARQSDDETGLGFDPFCRCQDFDNFRYTIQSVERRDNGGATARVGFINFNERHVVTLLLDYRNGRWLVADIREGRESLLAGR